MESAIAYGMQGEFREQLKTLMEKYNSPEVDRVASMMAKARKSRPRARACASMREDGMRSLEQLFLSPARGAAHQRPPHGQHRQDPRAAGA